MSIKRIIFLIILCLSCLEPVLAAGSNARGQESKAQQVAIIDTVLNEWAKQITEQQDLKLDALRREFHTELDSMALDTVKEEGDSNVVALAALALAAITLIVSLILFLSTRKSLGTINNVITEIDQKLAELKEKNRQMTDNSARFNDNLDKVSSRVSTLEQYLQSIQQTRPQETVVTNTKSQHQSSTPVQQQQKQDGKSKPKSETLYAQARIQNGEIILTAFGDEKKNVLPFLLSVTGDSCKVSFNNEAFTNVISSIETKLTPYVESKVSAKSTPSAIVTLTPGRASLQGKLWKLEVKPLLEIK